GMDPDRAKKGNAPPASSLAVSAATPTPALAGHVGNQNVQRLIQAKLTVGPAEDPCGQGAARRPRSVVTMAAPSISIGSSALEPTDTSQGGAAQVTPLAGRITPLVQPSGSV